MLAPPSAVVCRSRLCAKFLIRPRPRLTRKWEAEAPWVIGELHQEHEDGRNRDVLDLAAPPQAAPSPGADRHHDQCQVAARLQAGGRHLVAGRGQDALGAAVAAWAIRGAIGSPPHGCTGRGMRLRSAGRSTQKALSLSCLLRFSPLRFLEPCGPWTSHHTTSCRGVTRRACPRRLASYCSALVVPAAWSCMALRSSRPLFTRPAYTAAAEVSRPLGARRPSWMDRRPWAQQRLQCHLLAPVPQVRRVAATALRRLRGPQVAAGVPAAPPYQASAAGRGRCSRAHDLRRPPPLSKWGS